MDYVNNDIDIEPIIKILAFIQSCLLICSSIIFLLYLIGIIFIECIGYGIIYYNYNNRQEYLKANQDTFIFDNLIKYNAIKYIKLNENTDWGIEPFKAYILQYLLNWSIIFYFSVLAIFVFIFFIIVGTFVYARFIMKKKLKEIKFNTIYGVIFIFVLILLPIYLVISKSLYTLFENYVYKPGYKIYTNYIHPTDILIQNRINKPNSEIFEETIRRIVDKQTHDKKNLFLDNVMLNRMHENKAEILPNFIDFCNINCTQDTLNKEYLSHVTENTENYIIIEDLKVLDNIGQKCIDTRNELQNNMPIYIYFVITFIVLLIIIIMPPILSIYIYIMYPGLFASALNKFNLQDKFVS